MKGRLCGGDSFFSVKIWKRSLKQSWLAIQGGSEVAEWNISVDIPATRYIWSVVLIKYAFVGA